MYSNPKAFGISTAADITLKQPPSTVSLSKEGGFFSARCGRRFSATLVEVTGKSTIDGKGADRRRAS